MHIRTLFTKSIFKKFPTPKVRKHQSFKIKFKTQVDLIPGDTG